MKKRVLASFLTAVMVMGMVGCVSADKVRGMRKLTARKAAIRLD